MRTKHSLIHINLITLILLFSISSSGFAASSLNLTRNEINRDSTGAYYTTLRWTSIDTESCRAIGGWSGRTGTSGSQYIYPITRTTTYSMTCTGSQGSITESITIAVQEQEQEQEMETPLTPNTGSIEISWTPPSSNSDGSALTDLEGYRVYYGTSPSNLNSVINISSPGITSYLIENLNHGTYYFSISAIDTSGNESDRSNIAAILLNGD